MASTRQKGRRRELLAKKQLEAVGYDVQIAPMPTKYSTQNDLYGLWDLIAVNELGTRYIQVKSRKIYGVEREPYELWRNPPQSTKELWIYTKGSTTAEIMIL